MRENCQLRKFYFSNTEAVGKSHQMDDKELPISLAARIHLFDIKVQKQKVGIVLSVRGYRGRNPCFSAAAFGIGRQWSLNEQ